MEQWPSSTSDSDSDEEEEEAGFETGLTSSKDVGDAYCRYQGSFLSNLAKMLNEAHITGIDSCIKWHPKLCNALQVNWQRVRETYHTLFPVLVRYKICRANNSVDCARASWNRKLREWEFEMISVGSNWVTYTYKNRQFARGSNFTGLPMSRR